MNERALWHPVIAAHEVGASPVAARLLDEALVLWRDAGGGLQAWADRCPHRGTPLSLGRITDGRLECAYHGWRFGAGGACELIPALPDFVPGPAHGASAYAAREAFGLAWVRLAGSDGGPPSLGEVPPRRVLTGPYEVATSAPRVVENFLDMSHFPFVHAGSLGDRAHAAVPHYAVERASSGAPVVPHYRAWQPRASAGAAGGAWVEYRYEVLGPYSAVLFKHAGDDPGAPREAYALWVCPVAQEACRVWFTQFTSDLAAPEAELRAFQDAIFAQDRPIVEAQRPRRLPLAGGEAHCAADRVSSAYRAYLRERGITFGVC
jgi:phenylpropionate dioxygenase-like ring-hydroxylating dioxygenase large terminal subunit